MHISASLAAILTVTVVIFAKAVEKPSEFSYALRTRLGSSNNYESKYHARKRVMAGCSGRN